MYDHIKADIAAGNCLLEWDGGPEHAPPPVPLLKDKYASERRKAKILNFSIAYGKTAHGLSKDFGVSLQEAEETVERWYADRCGALGVWRVAVCCAVSGNKGAAAHRGANAAPPCIQSPAAAHGDIPQTRTRTPVAGPHTTRARTHAGLRCAAGRRSSARTPPRWAGSTR
jgi:DNA polymerase-1